MGTVSEGKLATPTSPKETGFESESENEDMEMETNTKSRQGKYFVQALRQREEKEVSHL